MGRRPRQATDSRDVSLTIPARPDYLVLARLALSAVCRLTPLSPEEVADLKLAITEAANDFVDEARPLDDESRLSFSFKLADDRLLMELDGPVGAGGGHRAGAEPGDHRGDRRRVDVRAGPHAAREVPEALRRVVWRACCSRFP